MGSLFYLQTIPSSPSAKTYNGSSQASGNTSATNAGTYTQTCTLSSTTNYKWSDSTTAAKNISWTINAKSISGATVTLGTTSYTYSGSANTPSVTEKDGSTTLTSGTDYTVAYTNNTNAGTATVTITGKGNYSGTATKTFTITAKSLTIPSSPSAKTYNGSSQASGITCPSGSTACVLR